MDIRLPDMPFSKRRQEAREGKDKQSESGAQPTAPPEASSENDELRRRIAIYRRIIERYRDMIEEHETKTVTELRSLVKPRDPAIVAMLDEIVGEFRPYLYEEHFEKAVERAYAFVREEIASEELPIDFWLMPEDVLELRAADEMDKAVILCSLIRALGCENAKVVVESNGERHVFVGYEHNGTYVLIDPTHEKKREGEKEEVIESEFGGKGKIVYEFNDKEYDEIIAGEE